MNKPRNYDAEVNHLLFLESKKHPSLRACVEAVAEQVRLDTELFDYLVRPQLEGMLMARARMVASNSRWVLRPENHEAFEAVANGATDVPAPRLIRPELLLNRNGREAIERDYLVQTFGKYRLGDWTVSALRKHIATRRAAIGTERKELTLLARVCDVAEQRAGNSETRIGDALDERTVARIFSGDYTALEPKRRHKRLAHRPSA